MAQLPKQLSDIHCRLQHTSLHYTTFGVRTEDLTAATMNMSSGILRRLLQTLLPS